MPVTEPAPSIARSWLKFYPRRASRGAIATASEASYCATLFNNSSGPQLLVVRFVCADPNQAEPTYLGYVQGQQGAPGGIVTPMVPDMPAQPGILTSWAAPSVTWVDHCLVFNTSMAYWPHEWPIAILPPNWSLAVYSQANQSTIYLVWDWVYAHEFDDGAMVLSELTGA